MKSVINLKLRLNWKFKSEGLIWDDSSVYSVPADSPLMFLIFRRRSKVLFIPVGGISSVDGDGAPAAGSDPASLK